jgi:hypothetical protein
MIVALSAIGCRPSDVLSVPPPATTVGFGDVHDLRTAENLYNGAKIALFSGLGAWDNSLILSTSTLSDEFMHSYLNGLSNIDARFTSGLDAPRFDEVDNTIQALLAAHSSLELAVAPLAKFEPTGGQWKVGEAYALIGYDELFMAEGYCAGVTLSQAEPQGGFIYGVPMTTDSLLALAEAHFDSALTNAHGIDTAAALAGVGLGRVRLDRGRVADAAKAVTSVATGFAYNAEYEHTRFDNTPPADLYAMFLPATGIGSECASWNVADREGGNGLNFVSAQDPRLVIDSTLAQTCNWKILSIGPAPYYYPTKFGDPTSTGLIPLATGVEARLIEAEAALSGGNIGMWTDDLNALRAAAPSTYLALASGMSPLTDDSSTAAGATERVDVLFRERAFWLFGTGTRLGDLRRLVRQYGRDQSTVFPTGPYPNGHSSRLPDPLPNYGTDVTLGLPTSRGNARITNPYYKGCLTPPSTA